MTSPAQPPSVPAASSTPIAAVEPKRLFPSSRYFVFAAILGVGLGWDLWTKNWVFAQLGYPHRQSEWSWQTNFLWGKFTITLFTSFNNGALWGMGQGYAPLFALLSVVASVAVCYVLFVKGSARSLWLTICLGLIGAGALGNLYDRLYLHGSMDTVEGRKLTGVRDFIKCDIPGIDLKSFKLIESWEFPIFNFADSFLVTGAIMLVLQALFSKEPLGSGQQAGTAGSKSPSAGAAAAGNPPHPSIAASVRS